MTVSSTTVASPKVVTTKELAILLAGASHGRVTVVTKSTPKALQKDRVTKEPNPYGLIEKVSTQHGQIGVNYSNCVNNQREREGVNPDFSPQEHAYADSVSDTPLMKNRKDGTLYVAFKREEAKHTNKSVYLADGKPVGYSEVANYLPVPRSDSGSQGTDKAVVWMTPKVASIIELRMGGEVYKVVNPKELTFADVQSLIASPKKAND